ncbi:carboxypeptidase-like regulatory domain-containing protein [Thermostilla marina]
MKSHRAFATALGLCAVGMLTFTLGCSKGTDRPKTYPVTGKVTYQGQPVPGATVVFVPEEPGTGENALKPAVGQTDDQGVYRLKAFADTDGAMPGRYRVKVTKFDNPVATTGSGGGDEGEEYVPPEESGDTGAVPQNVLPEKYANEATSGLTFTVEAKENTFDINLE